MDQLDSRIALLLQRSQPSLLKDYLDTVANQALLQYRTYWQWGKKQGESLYTHVLNGIFVLETLRRPLALAETEARVLFTAYTVHDINKVITEANAQSFNKLANEDNVATEIQRLNLPAFFPQWEEYLGDITSLVRGHGSHTATSGEMLVPKRAAQQHRLGTEHVRTLRHLMRAADTVDLSHTLPERKHKKAFLGHLNAFLADRNLNRQYEFFTHQLTEHRGLLTNVLHGAIADELEETLAVIPLLYYPDGIAYLTPKGRDIPVNETIYRQIAQRAAATISQMTRSKFDQFINSRPAGIKVDGKCLEMGVPFAGDKSILGEIYNLVQGKNLDPDRLETKARERAERDLAKNEADCPETAESVRAALEADTSLIPQSEERLKVAELIRSYYIFLNDHLSDQLDAADPWEHIYDLLDLPQERRPFYAYFDGRYDRANVLAHDLKLDEETVYHRIAEDGTTLLQEGDAAQDPKIDLLQDYLQRYLVLSVGGRPQTDFADHLAQYVGHQHKQCVHCSSPFGTDKWMSDDVRPDITVQAFSNRLRGGPGDPKKHVCAVCQIQFLLEKLNYPLVRGENLLYLHLFPYSFMTRPFIESLRTAFTQIAMAGTAIRALNLDAPDALQQWLDQNVGPHPNFRTQTKAGRPHSYGVYVPRYSETVGNLIILPLNAAGNNDTEQFLFALWNALVLQRHFGVKVLLSPSPVSPLAKEDFGDLYVDTVPLPAQGLLPTNNYRQFKLGQGDTPDNLPRLWQKAGYLQQLRRLTFTSSDNTPRLVRALAAHPLMIFHETDRLLEAKLDRQSRGLSTWLYQQGFTSVAQLARLQGGTFMKKLSDSLQELARIAWQHRLRGSSLERSSLLYPYNDVMQKIAQLQSNKKLDKETLKAAAAQDIFDHLERLAKREGYGAGRSRLDACVAFVSGWFNDVLETVYEGNARKMLADEKLLRSAYLFYVRNEIPRKEKKAEPNG